MRLRLAATAFVLAGLASACSDRTRDVPPVRFEPQEEQDAGMDAGDEAPIVDPDELCEGKADGASCELPNAFGVCARQQCRRVACEDGWGSCGGASGCETALSTVEDCGGCAVSCANGERCAAGPDGFECTAGIVCPPQRYDLDDDVQNGCEWVTEWASSYVLAPIDLQVEAVGRLDDAWVVAGGAADARISVELGAAPQLTSWPFPRGDVRALDVGVFDGLPRIVWSDMVTLGSDQTVRTHALQPSCATPRAFVGAAGDVVATEHELFRIVNCAEEDYCLEPFFSLADYQRAVAAEFAPSELTMCDGCASELPDLCWGSAQCRPDDADTSVCGDCSPSGCPTLEIVDVVASADGFAVVTARGVVLLDDSGAFLARAETLFDPNVAGGPRYVAGLGAPGEVTLVHSTGFARVLGPTLEPVFADLGLDFDPEVASMVGTGELIIAADAETARLIRPRVPSGRQAILGIEGAPGVQGISPEIAWSDGAQSVIFYRAAGQIYERSVSRAP